MAPTTGTKTLGTTGLKSGIKSPFAGPSFVLALAGIRRLVVQIKTVGTHEWRVASKMAPSTKGARTSGAYRFPSEFGTNTTRANSAHIRQSMPDSGLGLSHFTDTRLYTLLSCSRLAHERLEKCGNLLVFVITLKPRVE